MYKLFLEEGQTSEAWGTEKTKALLNVGVRVAGKRSTFV
jgi:hypothetical protein